MNNTPSSLLVCSGEEWYVNTANHVRKLAARKLAFCLSENPSVQMDLREFLDVKKFTSILVSDGFLTRLIFDFLDWRNGYEIVKK